MLSKELDILTNIGTFHKQLLHWRWFSLYNPDWSCVREGFYLCCCAWQWAKACILQLHQKFLDTAIASYPLKKCVSIAQGGNLIVCGNIEVITVSQIIFHPNFWMKILKINTLRLRSMHKMEHFGTRMEALWSLIQAISKTRMPIKTPDAKSGSALKNL